MVEQGARICTLAIWFQPDSRISSHLHPSPCTGSPTHSGLQHEVAAVHVLGSAHGVDHALPNRLPRAFESERGPRAAPLRLSRVTAHARKCARGPRSPRAPCGSGASGPSAGHSAGRLLRLDGLGLGGVTDRLQRLGSACPRLRVLSPGSFGREALGGRLAMSDPFPCKARVVAAAALSSTGCPVVLVVLVGLHLPEI